VGGRLKYHHGAGNLVPNPVKYRMDEQRWHIRLSITKVSARFKAADQIGQRAALKIRVFMDEN
jgi:hypothetical protein